MKNKNVLRVSVEHETDGGSYFHTVRWNKSSVQETIVDFEKKTIKTVLKNGEIHLADYKELDWDEQC